MTTLPVWIVDEVLAEVTWLELEASLEADVLGDVATWETLAPYYLPDES